MLTVAEATTIVRDHARRRKPEITALTSSALGQILAAPIVADMDSPPYDKAMMDGYALRIGTSADYAIVGEIAAGGNASMTLEAGQAVRIMTGAPIPPGTETVVMKERTTLLDEQTVRMEEVQAGKNILRQGGEMRAGEVVIEAGTALNPAHFGILGTVGRTTVSAYPPPRVGIMTTGNEIVEPMMKPKPGQIRNSNGPMLVGQTVRAGGLPRYLGLARDDDTSLRSLAREGLQTADILILSGGVSAGKYDLVPDVLAELGVTVRFHQVRMKPGKPLLFGTLNDTLVFGLPGNPVSALVCFELFVRPALQIMRGETTIGPMVVPMTFAEPFQTSNDRPTYWPAVEAVDRTVRALPWTGSADLRRFSPANVLLALPAGDVSYAPGDSIDVIRL